MIFVMLSRLEQVVARNLPVISEKSLTAAGDGSVSGSEVVTIGEEPSAGPVKQQDGDRAKETKVTGHAGPRSEVAKNDNEKGILVCCAPCWRELRRAREEG